MIATTYAPFLLLLFLSSAEGHVFLGEYRFPSVAFNFRFQDPSFRESEWDADIYLTGIPYYYDPTVLQQGDIDNQTSWGLKSVSVYGEEEEAFRDALWEEFMENDSLYYGMDDDMYLYGSGESTGAPDEVFVYNNDFEAAYDEYDMDDVYTNDDLEVRHKHRALDESAGADDSVYTDDASDDMYQYESYDDNISPRQWPTVLVAPYSYLEDGVDALINITRVADTIQATFIVLVLKNQQLQDNSIKANMQFWWNQKLPQLDDYLLHDHYYKNGTQKPGYFFIVIPPEEEEDFLRSLLYPGGIYDFVMDDVSFVKGRTVVGDLVCYIGLISFLYWWVSRGHTTTSSPPPNDEGTEQQQPQHAFHLLPFTSEDLGHGEIQNSTNNQQEPDRCAICLEAMPTGTNVCVFPCRHVFHPACVDNWLVQQQQRIQNRDTTEEGTWDGTNPSHQLGYCCPLCKFDLRQHFIEHRAAKLELPTLPQTGRIMGLLQRSWRHRTARRAAGQVLLEDSRGEGGDLELTVEDTQNTTTARDTEVNLVV